jgi:Ribosomally synthesized peptide prototyped by Frankia Franean1_4349.
MSQKAVEQFIGRLVTDARFRERALHDLNAVCIEEGYDLTDAELHIVGSLDFDRLAQAEEFWLDDRIKRFNSYV